MPVPRTWGPGVDRVKAAHLVAQPIRPARPIPRLVPQRPASGANRYALGIGPGVGPGLLAGGGVLSNVEAALQNFTGSGTGPVRSFLAGLGFGHLPPPPGSKQATLAAVADDGSTSKAVTYGYGDEMKVEVTVPSNLSPSAVVAYINGSAGTTHPWTPSTQGYTYTIDFGAAPSTDEVADVYCQVTFSDGSTAKTNQVVITVSSSGGGGGVLPKYFSGSWSVLSSPTSGPVSGSGFSTSDVAGSQAGAGGDSYSLTDGDPLTGVVDGFEPMAFNFGAGIPSVPLGQSGNSPRMQARRVSHDEWHRAQSERRSRVRFALNDPITFDHSVTWSFGDGGSDSGDAPGAHTYKSGNTDYQGFQPSLTVSVKVTDSINGKSRGFGPTTFGTGVLRQNWIGRWPTDMNVGSNNDVVLTSSYHNGAPVSNCRVLARFKNCIHSGTGWQIYTTDSNGSTGNMYGGGNGEIYTTCLRNPKLTACLSFGGWPCGC